MGKGGVVPAGAGTGHGGDDAASETAGELTDIGWVDAPMPNSRGSKFQTSNEQPYFPSVYEEFVVSGVNIIHKRGIMERINLTLDDPASCKIAMTFSVFILVIILMSIVCFVNETIPSEIQMSDSCKAPRDFVFDGQTVSLGCDEYIPYSMGLNANGEDIARLQRQALVEAIPGVCDHCEPEPKKVYAWLEMAWTFIFSVEYLGKLITCWSFPCADEREYEPVKVFSKVVDGVPSHKYKFYQYKSWKWLRRIWNFVTNRMNLIDVVSVLPYYLGDAVPSTTFLRVLRLVRILKMGKVLSKDERFQNFSDGMMMIILVFEKAFTAFVMALIYMVVFTLLMGAILYVCERGTWSNETGMYMVPDVRHNFPDVPSKFTSIPVTMWWVVVTTTTVGYGDIVPTSQMGRFFGTLTMYGGIVLLALPITIIGATFQEVYDTTMKRKLAHHKKLKKYCRFIINFKQSGAWQLSSAFKQWQVWARMTSSRETRFIDTLMQVNYKVTSEIAELRSSVKELKQTLALIADHTGAKTSNEADLSAS